MCLFCCLLVAAAYKGSSDLYIDSNIQFALSAARQVSGEVLRTHSTQCGQSIQGYWAHAARGIGRSVAPICAGQCLNADWPPLCLLHFLSLLASIVGGVLQYMSQLPGGLLGQMACTPIFSLAC